MTLPEIRKHIDALDEQLLRLLNERADLVHEVGVVKKAEGAQIYAPEREETVLRALAAKNAELKGPSSDGDPGEIQLLVAGSGPQQSVDLVLINRKLDADNSDGMEILQQILGDKATARLPVQAAA